MATPPLDVSLQLQLVNDALQGEDGVFEALVAANQKWLGHYARMHASFSIEPSLLEPTSLWMNAYFQKQRMITSPWTKQAKALVAKHQQAIQERLRSAPPPHLESEYSTTVVDPMAALMFAASVDRCPEYQIEYMMGEAMEWMECPTLLHNASRSGFGGCVFRFLIQFTEARKRIMCLELLLVLAQHDADALIKACQIAGQGQLWQPHMFIYMLQKRHHDNSTICNLAGRLLEHFTKRMPIASPVQLDTERNLVNDSVATRAASVCVSESPVSRGKRTYTLPTLGTSGSTSPLRSPHSPTTTMSAIYAEGPSPYSPVKLPLTRPATSATEQTRRSTVFSQPKLAAVEGERRRRCQTPNVSTKSPQQHEGFESYGDEDGSMTPDANRRHRSLDPLDAPKGPEKKITISEKYSWNPDCINSVSGFEWWWRSLPQNHASLEPTQKLKMVTKAAVRVHTKGEWQRAIDLYVLALSMEINEDVEFRLRINLACAYEGAEEWQLCVNEFRSALRLNPGDPYGHYKLGTALTMLAAFDEARQELQAVLDVYPQAAEAVSRVDEAEQKLKEKNEAEKAALATARTSRSPLTKRRELQQQAAPVTSPTSPRTIAVPPKTSPRSTTTGPTPRKPFRKDRPQSSEANATSSGSEATSDQNPNPNASGVLPPVDLQPIDLAPSDLLDVVVHRCRQLMWDLSAVFTAIDVHKTGLIRKESLLEVLRIICAADVDGEEILSGAFNLSSDDRLLRGNVEYIRYNALLETYNTRKKKQLLPVEFKDATGLKDTVDALARKESLGHHNDAVVYCAVEWVDAGLQKAVQVTTRKAEPTQADSRRSQGPATKDVGHHSSSSDGLSGKVPDTLQDGRDTPDSVVEDDHFPVPEEAPSNSHAARLIDKKREEAHQREILRNEQARIIARKHVHCMKSLQDIGNRARRHLATQQSAREYLLRVGADARLQVKERVNADSSQQEPKETLQPQSADITDVKALAQGVYATAVDAALAKMKSRPINLKDLQLLAQKYSAECFIRDRWRRLITDATEETPMHSEREPALRSKGFVRIRPLTTQNAAAQSALARAKCSTPTSNINVRPQSLLTALATPVKRRTVEQIQDRYHKKSQELCDSIRNQYDLIIQRLEAQHERFLQAMQLRLHEALRSMISVDEHQQRVTQLKDNHVHELESLHEMHQRELEQQSSTSNRELKQELRNLAQAAAEEKNFLLDHIQELQMQHSNMTQLVKEKELEILNVKSELQESQRTIQLAHGRFQEACQHILTLKAQLKKTEIWPRKVADEKSKKTEFREKWENCKAQMEKCEMNYRRKIELLEMEIHHLRTDLAQEKAAFLNLQPQVPKLQEQIHLLEKEVLESKAAEGRQVEFRELERAQFQKEIAALQETVSAQAKRVTDAKQAIKALEQIQQELRERNRELQVTLEMGQRQHAEALSAVQHQLHQVEKQYARAVRKLQQLHAAHEELRQDQHVAKLLFND